MDTRSVIEISRTCATEDEDDGSKDVSNMEMTAEDYSILQSGGWLNDKVNR